MSKYLLRNVVGLPIFGAVVGTAAAEPARLSLTVAAERALAHEPSVAAAAAAGDEALASAAGARAARLPVVNAVASGTRYQKQMVATPIHGLGDGQTPPFDDLLLQGGLGVSWSLFDGGARRSRIRSAESQAEAAAAGLDAVRQAVVERVVSTYVEALGHREVLAAHDRRILALEAERSRVRQLLAVGRAADVDMLRVEAALASGEADRTRVAAALDRAERDLAAMIGLPVEETRAGRLASLAPTAAPPPPREALVRQALETSPVVEEARRRQAVAEAALALAKSARWPQARLVGNYLAFGGRSTRAEAEWNAGIQVSAPVFDGGVTGKAIAKAEAGRRAADARLRQAELQVASGIDAAMAALQEAHAGAASLTTAVARLEEVVRVQKLLLETGQGTQIDYLAAEADLLAARASLSQAQLGEIEARAGLARAAGGLTPAWIEKNVEERS